MKNLESKLFLLIAFFIGTWGALFHAMQTGLIALGLIYNIVKYKDDFVRNIKKYKYYVAIPVIYILYSAVHTLIIVTSGKYAGLKPGFGIFEKEFLVFLLGVLYVISLKSFVSLRLLKQFLLCFCISVLTFNLVMLFHLGGENWFTAPQTVVQNLYASRFGGTKHFLNGEVYLDAQALQIYAAALIAYFFGIIRTKMGEKVIAFTAFALFVWLLSLTVTKSSILSFLCGFVIFNLYFFRKLSVWQRWMFIGVILLVGIRGYIFRPASFDQRWIQLKQEIEDVNNGKLDGGSTLVPRIVFYQSCLKNIDSWGIWGLGVYTNVVSKQWYQASGNRVVASLTHSHNSYLQYWMLMGVVGLVFILSWFVYPVKSMICSKKYSFLALSLLVAFFIDSNFEVLLIVNDALPVVMFFLMMFYVFRDQFYALEHESD